jgi:hypothetical protein
MSGKRQKIQYLLALVPKGRGEAPVRSHQGTEPSVAKPAPESPACAEQLMEEVCDRGNLERAWKRVRSNKGGPGVDGMTIDEAKGYLREHWPDIRSQLLKGTYQPRPVKRVEIPKPEGGGQKARRTLCRRSADSASLAAGSPGAVGLDVLPAQLRLPTETFRPSGGGPGTAIHRRGLQRGG